MKNLIIILIVFFVTACQNQANFKNNMDSWVGGSAQNLVDNWGYPANSLKAPNGNEVYVYLRSGSYKVPETTTYDTTSRLYGNTLYSTTTGNTTGGYEISLACTVYVEINAEKKIEKITWQGNNCVA